MGLSQFTNKDTSSKSKEQKNDSSSAKEKPKVDKDSPQDADGEESYNKVDSFLVEYNLEGEFMGPTYPYWELDGVELHEDHPLWDDAWVDLTDEMVRWEKKVNGKRCRMKRYDCVCGKHHSRGAGSTLHRCMRCNRVIVDREAPDGSFIHEGQARHNVREIWDEFDRAGSSIELPDRKENSEVDDTRTSEVDDGVQADEEDEPQTGLGQFMGGVSDDI